MGQALSKFYTARFVEGTDAGNEAIAKYGVQAFPTLLVIDHEGEVVDEVAAWQPGPFVEELDRILAGKDTLKALRAAMAVNADDLDAGLELANKLSMRAPEESLALARRLRPLAAKKGTAEAIPFMAAEIGALSMLDENEDAWKVVEEALATDVKGEPMDAIVMHGLQLAYMGSAEKALAYIARVTGRASEVADGVLERSKTGLYIRAADEAILRMGQRAGDDADMLNEAAWMCYLRNIHTEEALAWARKAVTLSGEEAHILDTLAHLLYRNDELEKAIRVQRKAVAKAELPSMKEELEEALAKFEAVKKLRDSRE